MKTPWRNLLNYGVGVATIIMLCAAGVILFAVVGVAIIIAKLSFFIR